MIDDADPGGPIEYDGEEYDYRGLLVKLLGLSPAENYDAYILRALENIVERADNGMSLPGEDEAYVERVRTFLYGNQSAAGKPEALSVGDLFTSAREGEMDRAQQEVNRRLGILDAVFDRYN